METEVARKIENSVATLQGVKHIYTKVQDGTATITVEFRLEKGVQEALDDVRDAVARIRSDLPGDLRDPQITKVELAGLPILTYTVASSRMDDEACPGSSTTPSPRPCSACAASARWRGWAA
jgi:multidrug efflux pump subunit AcrB